jgi:hypothetical protein
MIPAHSLKAPGHCRVLGYGFFFVVKPVLEFRFCRAKREKPQGLSLASYGSVQYGELRFGFGFAFGSRNATCRKRLFAFGSAYKRKQKEKTCV